MTRFSQIAAPAILGAALIVGAQGCAHESPPVAGTSNMLSEGRKTVSATATSLALQQLQRRHARRQELPSPRHGRRAAVETRNSHQKRASLR